MMRPVPGRVSSPAFIGRRDQLDALRAALAGIERDPRRVVLVHGEAGIGKTRLLDEFARSATDEPLGGRPTRILRGTCIELGSGELPFAPVLDVLDELAKGSDSPDDSAAAWALRDELGGAGSSEGTSPVRGRIFVGIRDLLVRTAVDADVIVCIDDLHWADRSTLELLTFLATRLVGSRVLLLLAYRSDEIHRQHLLRPVLAELERGAVAAEVPLAPLGRSEIRDQLAAILGTPPSASRLDRIVTLADGNPFHAEELVALGIDVVDLPRSLRDVLLARLERLDPPTVGLLGRAAAIGRDIDEGLLIAVSGLPGDGVRIALRQAVDHHVLEPTPDGRGYRFRHALLREAVLGDLLPSERVALHRQVAETLEARPELAASSPATAAAELSYHWTEAGDAGRALPALIESGQRAKAARAWSEASDAFERAADLAAGGAGSLTRIERAELRMSAARLTGFSGEATRGLALARAAVAEDDGSDPRRSGALLTWLGFLANDAGDYPEALAAAEAAVALIPERPLSMERADAVSHLAGRRMERSRCREAIQLADAAIVLCRAVGAQARLGATLSIKAISAASLGRAAETRAAIDESMELGRGLGDDGLLDVGSIVANDAAALWNIGDFDRVPTFVDESIAWATEIGGERGWIPWLEPSAAIAAFLTGDWRAAEERLERFRADAEASYPLMDTLLIEGHLAAGHGDRARVESLLADNALASSSSAYEAMYLHVRAVAALWDRDAGAAAGLAERALDVVSTLEEIPILTDIIKTAARAYADLAERHVTSRAGPRAALAAGRADELRKVALALDGGTYLDGAMSTPWMHAIALEVVAESGRAAQRSDPAAWDAAAGAHVAVGTMPDVAYCRYREGEALLLAGDRAGATARVAEAHAIAARIGMTPLVGQIEALARRARLTLEVPTAAIDPAVSIAPVDPWGLSLREREVLALLGEGRTNRQIGEALFISDKTASVHVTHILVKMGVSSRTEAALLAGRSGVAATGTARIATEG